MRSLVFFSLRRCQVLVLAMAIGLAVATPHSSGEVASDGGTGEVELARKALHNLYGSSYIQMLELATSARSGAESSQRRLQIVRLEEDRGARALMRFVSPPALEGTGALFVSRPLGDVDVFVHLPSYRITRRISGANKEDAFFGTALTFADLEPKQVDDYHVVQDGETKGGCEQLRLEGKTDLHYDRIDICAEPVTGLVHRLRFFAGPVAVKEVVPEVESTRRVGTRWLPFTFEVRDLSSGTRTTVVTTSYEEIAGAEDALFTMGNLERGTPRGDYGFAIVLTPDADSSE